MAEVDVNPIPENVDIEGEFDETAEREADHAEFHEDVSALQYVVARFESEYPGLLGVGLVV